MVEARQEDDNTDNQDRKRAVAVLDSIVPGQQQGAVDDQQGANQEEEGGKRDRLVRDFGWGSFELQINVSVVVMTGQSGVLHLVARASVRHKVTSGHLSLPADPMVPIFNLQTHWSQSLVRLWVIGLVLTL